MASGVDWVDWHRAYDDPDSSLTRRLLAVRREVALVLHRLPSGPIKIVSLCAGDGRDLLGAVAEHPRTQDVDAVLIERDPRLAAAATSQVVRAGLSAQITVREADAGDVTNFADVLPTDLLILCGVLGNLSDEDVTTTVRATVQLVRVGGYAIWTRGSFAPDRRQAIRAQFLECGCEEIAFESEPDGYGVGVVRVVAPGRANGEQVPSRLFSFIR